MRRLLSVVPLVAAVLGPVARPVAGAQPSPPAVAPGVYETRRMNDRPLPFVDRVVDDEGWEHAIRLADMIIRVRGNGRFSAALKYQRALLGKGERVEAQPLQKDTWQGRWVLEGSAITFYPEPQGRQRTVRPFRGTVRGRRIDVPFEYDIVKRKTYQLQLTLNPDIF